VQVKVSATALNHIDVWMRRGLPALHLALPHVSGGDVCGTVSALGVAVTGGQSGVDLGERVVLNPACRAGRWRGLPRGRDNFCPDFRMLGEQTWGGHAEYVVVPAANLVPVPRAAVPLEDTDLASNAPSSSSRPGRCWSPRAAPSGRNGARARCRLRRGQRQHPDRKLWGARVIATASPDEKLAAARALGRDRRHQPRAATDIVAASRSSRIAAAPTSSSSTWAPRPFRSRSWLREGGAHRHLRRDRRVRAGLNCDMSSGGSCRSSGRRWPPSRASSISWRSGAGRLRPSSTAVLPLADVATGHRLIESRAGVWQASPASLSGVLAHGLELQLDRRQAVDAGDVDRPPSEASSAFRDV